jgi:hypothetical protein
VGSTTSPVHARRGQQGAATCGGVAANGGRRLARRRVETGHLAPSKRSWSSPTVAFRRGAWTAGFAGVAACTRARRRAWARSGVPGLLAFHSTVFKIAFLQFFKLKCIIRSEAKLKIRHSFTTFTKLGRGLVQAMEQERHANLTQFSAPVNRNRTPSKAFFTKNSFEFQMSINSKVVCLNILHIFPFGRF